MISISVDGHLGKDASVRDVDGKPVTSFTMAGNNQKDEPPTWFNVSLWGPRGPRIVDWLKKGRHVSVRGSLRMRSYKDNSGADRTSLDVRADDIAFMGRQDDAGSSKPAAAGRDDYADRGDGSEIPF